MAAKEKEGEGLQLSHQRSFASGELVSLTLPAAVNLSAADSLVVLFGLFVVHPFMCVKMRHPLVVCCIVDESVNCGDGKQCDFRLSEKQGMSANHV